MTIQNNWMSTYRERGEVAQKSKRMLLYSYHKRALKNVRISVIRLCHMLESTVGFFSVGFGIVGLRNPHNLCKRYYLKVLTLDFLERQLAAPQSSESLLDRSVFLLSCKIVNCRYIACFILLNGESCC